MTDTRKAMTEAERLAKELDAEQSLKHAQWQTNERFHPAAAELRRLHEENARLKKHLLWALSNINCEPFEWSDEENADAHKAALAALGEKHV